MKRILWVDLEMTGLDPETCVIIEFAGIVTDLEFRPIETYHSVVFQPQEELAKMDAWNQATHHRTGLAQRVPSGKPLADVERKVIAFAKTHFGDEKPVLAGNSIHQDRRFIDRYMPEFSRLLHYRMIDVSGFKLLFQHRFNLSFTKRETHRALDDILESIEELKYYVTFIQPGDIQRSEPCAAGDIP